MFHVEHMEEIIMSDVDKLEIAIFQAKKALEIDEIPVGCAIYRGDELIACGYNRKESENNAIMHAEIVAINEACGKLKSWRLEGCSLYVTLEPCMMCMGAIIESRIKEVYYGTAFNGIQIYDKNCIKSAISIKNIQNDECSKMLSSFFEKKRKK